MVKSLIISFIILLLPHGLFAKEAGSAARDFQKANQLFASARYQDALSLYQTLLDFPPHGVSAGDIYSRIGDCWFRLSSFRNALAAYRIAIQNQKESLRPETQYWIGFCCFLLGRDAEALNEFLKIPAHYPDAGMWIGTAYYWAGRAAERMGKTEEAASYYRKAGGNGKSTQGKFALKKAEAVKGRSTKSQAPNSK